MSKRLKFENYKKYKDKKMGDFWCSKKIIEFLENLHK
jgi:hypothetical protein